MAQRITKRETDYSRWYTDTIIQAKLADYSPVKGCMVIRPNGFSIWENMQRILDGMFKETGHENAYFPLFIPESFMQKEAEHVEGFAPEAAVVTHGGGEKLEEPLYVRPTSETIIWSMYKKWIMSYRDLPILINQWANVVRWEMRTRLFLRTTEFLWQEGHTAHADEQEAREETLTIINLYKKFAEEYLAIPVIIGRKTDNEKFAGAIDTYTIEAMMQDKKALQAGTSHYLGENFAKAFDVKFQDKDGKVKYVHATSWGVSTRLIGALIMVHGDDNGLVIPPRIAPRPVVIVPIWRDDAMKEKVLNFAENIYSQLKTKWKVILDDRDQYKPGYKFNEWEVVGIPVRIEIGPRDVEQNQVVVARRDAGEKLNLSADNITDKIEQLLEDIQQNMFNKALEYRNNFSYDVDSFEEFKKVLENKGGFLYSHWCGSGDCELKIKEETKATIRCIPEENKQEEGQCIYCGKPSKERVIFARNY
ncbi:MAG: proline--tRNA ligase [Calditrichia bacterium]